MVDFYGINVGKYTSHMDPMGNNLHSLKLTAKAPKNDGLQSFQEEIPFPRVWDFRGELLSFREGAPRKINIEPEDDSLENDFHFPIGYSQVPC